MHHIYLTLLLDRHLVYNMLIFIITWCKLYIFKVIFAHFVQVLKGEATEEERKVATQLRGPLMPVQQPAPKSVARVITDEEKDFKAYQYLRGVRYTFYYDFWSPIQSNSYIYVINTCSINWKQATKYYFLYQSWKHYDYIGMQCCKVLAQGLVFSVIFLHAIVNMFDKLQVFIVYR